MAGPGRAVNRFATRISRRVATPEPAARSELPEEGLEPTRTYAQALLRRPRLPFRHSGVPDIVSNASNARIALVRLASAGGPGASISRVRSLGTYQRWSRLKARTTIATWWAGPAGAIGRRLPN